MEITALTGSDFDGIQQSISNIKVLHSTAPVDLASATVQQKEVLDQVLEQVSFIPNIYANMTNALGTLSTQCQ